MIDSIMTITDSGHVLDEKEESLDIVSHAHTLRLSQGEKTLPP